MRISSRNSANSALDASVSAANALPKKIAGVGTEVVVKIDGLTELHRNIDALYEHLEDFDYILDIIESDYYERAEAMFAKEGSVEGNAAWRALSPMYKQAKVVEYPGTKILERSGDLRDSFCVKGNKSHFYMRTPTSLAIGSKLKTADGKYYLGKLHQHGYVRPLITPVSAQTLRWMGPGGNPIFAKRAKSVKVPARPMAIISSKQRDIWSKAFHQEFAKVWDKK